MVKYIKKCLLFGIGIVILSIGIALTIWAKDLGVSPWDVFHIGLTNVFSLSFGRVCQIVGAVVVLISFGLGIKPRFGTIFNTITVGWMINVCLDLLPENTAPGYELTTFVVFLAGIGLTAIGTGLYITADMGSGPRDSLMLGLNHKFGIRISVARTSLEILVVILGFLLGGPVGVGTVLFSLTIGFLVEKSLNLFKRFKVSEPLTADNSAVSEDI